ncbi:unnamed protein product [Adineta ricciae]|uniref:Transporter n=1 Tax=Adineta ricciae TaxID=249248 RepID=A0A814PKJ9_ADIRI|nr:unnamed protein product [Adineta ricciae]CAF1159428.1 unnamed protein product [Adineta ricciae]
MKTSVMNNIERRDKWSGNAEFLLSCIGFAIGLGNVWRFPYLCYEHGGGAFLIPYYITLICAGIPLFFLEVALGQHTSIGGLGIWKICPILKGTGYAATIIVFWLNCYYIVVLAWAFYYIYHSFIHSSLLPWTTCGNWWNQDSCRTLDQLHNYTSVMNCTSCEQSMRNHLTQFTNPVKEFWDNNVLQITNDISEPGSFRVPLVITLALAWILCYFCIWKGIQWTGKIVYFTSMFPYLLLMILLIRGLTLDGAMDGVKYLFIPDVSKLKTSALWIEAATQIFFSYGLGLGVLVALGSYNKRHTNCYRDTLLLAVFNEATCLISGLVIFSVIGFLAKTEGKAINEVAESGPSLAFVVYPAAVAQLPFSRLWSVLFFVMLIFIGLDSQGGMYVFKIFDYYSASGWCLLIVLFFECIGVSWFYGADRFYEDINNMIGYYPNQFWKWCWKSIAIFSLVKYEPVTYKKYRFPKWAEYLGWSIALSSIVAIPIYAIAFFARQTGTLKERWNTATRSTLNDNEQNESMSYEESVALNNDSFS